MERNWYWRLHILCDSFVAQVERGRPFLWCYVFSLLCFVFVFVFLLSLTLRRFIQSFFDTHSMCTDSHTELPNSYSSLCPLLFCIFFVSLEVLLFPSFCTIPISSSYGEYTVLFSLPDGVFLACVHGLEF